MPRINRRPTSIAEGLVGTRGATLVPDGEVSYTFATSQHLVDLLYSGPRKAGIIARFNEVHRDMALEITGLATSAYWRARARRPNKRRDARRWFRLEGALTDMVAQGARGHPVYQTPTGAQGIRGGVGFKVDFTVLDNIVVNPEDGFPYWRSVEFGYKPFMADRPIFVGRGNHISFPSGARRSDVRMPQRVPFAPFEQVWIKGFRGYGMFTEVIRRVSAGPESFTNASSFNYYLRYIERWDALPNEWAQALDLIRGGFRPKGPIGNRRLSYGGSYRGPGGRFTTFDPRF